jgi:hypothetical protein
MRTAQQLRRLFARKGIDFAKPGFYDTPQFLAAEREDSRFLETYAEFVSVQRFDRAYVARAREVIPNVVATVSMELSRAARHGACVDVSGLIMRMLEAEGIWSYAIGGAVEISFPGESNLPPSYFWPITLPDNPIFAGHMWVCAPPFKVVDVALPVQQWTLEKASYFPEYVLSDLARPAEPTVGDLLDADAVRDFVAHEDRLPTMEDVRRLTPWLFPFMRSFRAFAVVVGQLRIKYVPTKVSATDRPLADMVIPELNGKRPRGIYADYKQQHP